MKQPLLSLSRLAALMLALSFGFNLSAQSLFWNDGKPAERLTLGARFDWNFARLGGDAPDNYNGRNGFGFGASADINIFKSLSVNTGLFFTMKGCTYEADRPVGDMINIPYKFTEAVNFLEIPVYVSYHLRFRPDEDLQIYFGPYIDLGVYGKLGMKMRDSDDAYSQTKENMFGKHNMGYHRWQYGLGLGASYTFAGHYLVGLRYQWGVKDVAELVDARWNCCQLTVGYNF
ncbi:MAG: PorT family protein [Bacteroides sp.]|nr:PorT family protein [Bacteroides sp.]